MFLNPDMIIVRFQCALNIRALVAADDDVMLVCVGLKWSLRSFQGLMGTSCGYQLIMTVLSY